MTAKFSWNMKGMVVRVPWERFPVDARVTRSAELLPGEIARSKATHEFVRDGEAATTDLPVVMVAELRERMADACTDYAAFLGLLKRTAYVPVLQHVAMTPEWARCSRYFGKPWMPGDMDWPKLGGRPMAFVLRLDLATIPWKPEGMPDQGLLLFFHGTEYSDVDEQSALILVVDNTVEGGLRGMPDGIEHSRSLCILDWRETVDIPHPCTLATMDAFEPFNGVSPVYGTAIGGRNSIVAENGQAYTEDGLILYDVRPLAHTYTGDKIGGWPDQDFCDETAPIDENGEPYEFFMQLSDDGFRGSDLLDAALPDDGWPIWGTGHLYFRNGVFKYMWNDGTSLQPDPAHVVNIFE